MSMGTMAMPQYPMPEPMGAQMPQDIGSPSGVMPMPGTPQQQVQGPMGFTGAPGQFMANYGQPAPNSMTNPSSSIMQMIMSQILQQAFQQFFNGGMPQFPSQFTPGGQGTPGGMPMPGQQPGMAGQMGWQMPGQQVPAGGGVSGPGQQMPGQMMPVGGGAQINTGPNASPQNMQMGGPQGWGQPMFGPPGVNPTATSGFAGGRLGGLNTQLMSVLDRIFPGYSQRAMQAYTQNYGQTTGQFAGQMSRGNPFDPSSALGQAMSQGDPWAAGVADRRAAGYAGDPRYDAAYSAAMGQMNPGGSAPASGPSATSGDSSISPGIQDLIDLGII